MASDSQKIEDIISYMTSLTVGPYKILGDYRLIVMSDEDFNSQDA